MADMFLDSKPTQYFLIGLTQNHVALKEAAFDENTWEESHLELLEKVQMLEKNKMFTTYDAEGKNYKKFNQYFFIL